MKKEVNIKEHILVPKHLLLSAEECEKLLVQYNITKKQMPRISTKDPALTGLEVKKGDIIKIVRDSPTALQSHYYRVVV